MPNRTLVVFLFDAQNLPRSRVRHLVVCSTTRQTQLTPHCTSQRNSECRHGRRNSVQSLRSPLNSRRDCLWHNRFEPRGSLSRAAKPAMHLGSALPSFPLPTRRARSAHGLLWRHMLRVASPLLRCRPRRHCHRRTLRGSEGVGAGSAGATRAPPAALLRPHKGCSGAPWGLLRLALPTAPWGTPMARPGGPWRWHGKGAPGPP